MNVSELYRLTKWIKAEIVDAEIPQKYQELQTLLHQNAQPNQQSVPFESQKEELLNALRLIQTTSLSNDQLSFLSGLGIGPLIGKAGAATIEDILFRNAIDIATAAQKLAKRTQVLNERISKSNMIAEGLSGLVKSYEEDAADGVLMRVSFVGDALIENVSDFKRWGETWYSIARGVTQAHNSAPEEIRVVGAAKGSVILELLADPIISGTVASIIWGALKVSEKVLNLKKIAAETRGLNLQEKKLAAEIENAAEKEESAGVENISIGLIKKLKLKDASDGDKISALKKSVTELVKFITDGGEVDFVTPEEEIDGEGESSDNGFAQVRGYAENIRRLENKLKLLEDNREQGENV